MNEHREWIDDVWNKILVKTERTAKTIGDKFFPYISKSGKFSDCGKNVSWWTNGFWPGIMWLIYSETKNELYKNIADNLEEKLDEVIATFTEMGHDVGFIWIPSSVANYKITGNEKSRARGLYAASTLAGRFNPMGNFIRAWKDWTGDVDNRGRAIIDCMMNIQILFWASEETNDPRFKHIATKHADTAIEHFIRNDGSVKHIVEFNPETGEYVKNYTGQGYSEESSWTRGQGWALYGFILCYMHTGEDRYLDAAKRVAHYFISALGEDYIPPCDFRSPKAPEYKDTTAGAIAACGLIEIAKAVGEFEKELYLNAAIKIIKSLAHNCCDWSETEDSILQRGTEAYHGGEANIPIIYGDYYFIEAICKLRGSELLFW